MNLINPSAKTGFLVLSFNEYNRLRLFFWKKLNEKIYLTRSLAIWFFADPTLFKNLCTYLK
jgi:hypothetical protein